MSDFPIVLLHHPRMQCDLDYTAFEHFEHYLQLDYELEISMCMVIVDEGEARINYQLVEIESE